MKTKTFLAALAACVMTVSCSNESDETVNGQSSMVNDTEVTLTFSPYDMTAMGGETRGAMRRAAASIAAVTTHLDVWLYEGGSEVAAVHQSSTDDGFGTVTATLDKTKTYTMYAVAHKADGAATLSDGVISFPDDKVTHAMYYSTSFSPSTTTSLSCLMTRIVAQFRLEITDDIPDECKKLQFTITDVYDRWNVTDGGTHNLDRTSIVTYNGTSSTFIVYAIVTDAATTHDITVVSMDENDQELQTRTFSDVPLRNGYKTTYRGAFFTDATTSASFVVDDWSAYDTVEF